MTTNRCSPCCISSAGSACAGDGRLRHRLFLAELSASFPFDKIKIDRGFIARLSEGPSSVAILRAIAGLGRSLGVTTTAEGVETQAQLEQVRDEGCTEVQGYLFSRPVPAAHSPRFFPVRELSIESAA